MGEEALGGLVPPATAAVTPATRALRLTQIATILAVAAALRLGVSWFLPGMHHVDELFQALEQAHRLTFGYGVIPWEWRAGARSWLLPGGLSLLLDIGRRFTDDPMILVFMLRAALGALSCSIVLIAYLWGERFSRRHALITAVAVAGWLECVYFSGRPFGEVVATPFVFIGFFTATVPTADRRSFMIAGLSLGVAAALRFQLAPAVGVAVLMLARRDFRGRWLPMLLGMFFPLGGMALLDGLTWGGVPLHSIIENFRINIIHNRSVQYGIRPAGWYLEAFVGSWGGAALAIVLLAWVGARKAPVFLVFAAVCLLTHSMIQHKEYRFVYPAVVALVFLAGLGSAELLKLCRSSTVALTVGIVGWLGTSLALAVQPQWLIRWQRGKPILEVTSFAGGVPGICGLGIYRIPWQLTGGYTYLHRNVPQYLVTDIAADWPRFNVALAPGQEAQLSQHGFSLLTCRGAQESEPICVYRRPGSCVGDGDSSINSYLEKADQ